MAELSDHDLVLRARIDATGAFQQLVDRYKKKIYFTALGVVGIHQDAEDIMQETFLQAFKSIAKLRNPGGFGAWIMRIAFNRSVDVLRKRKREVIPGEDENGRQMFDRLESGAVESNPERIVNSGEITVLVQATLEELPESQRSAFILKHIVHLSIHEIAVITSSTESTVKTNIYRAVQRLRLALSPFMLNKSRFSFSRSESYEH